MFVGAGQTGSPTLTSTWNRMFAPCEMTGHDNTYAGVHVAIADHLGDRVVDRVVDVVDQSVVTLDCADLADEPQHRVGVVRQRLRLEVEFVRRTSGVVRGEQYAAFQHQVLAMTGQGEPTEESFQRVQREQLVRGAHFGSRLLLQVQVRPTARRVTRRNAHNSASNARRSGVAARGNCWAIASNLPGCAPRPFSHRRSAS